MQDPSRTPDTGDSAAASHSFAELEQWWHEARAGRLAWSELAERLWALEHPPSRDHCPDRDRARRCGFGEVIYGSGKSPEDIVLIARRLLEAGQEEVLVTRVQEEQARQLESKFAGFRFDPIGRIARLANRKISAVRRFTFSPLLAEASSRTDADPAPPLPSPAPHESAPSPLLLPSVAVVTGGSTDQHVAQEALETLRWMGIQPLAIRDIGVAGPYRLIPHLPALRKSAAVVVVAGMEGALASVVGGQVPCPVIAVPTSVGYGANLQGVTTMLSMLSSCAAGVTTVNIDAGFKGGYIAGLIAHQVARGVPPA